MFANPLLSKLAVASICAALAAAFSCKTFSLPAEVCDPAALDATRLRGESAGDQCTRCLEDDCCDVVGVCERKGGCPETVSGVHGCVLDAGLKGAEKEKECAAKLTTEPEANDAYRCMRDRCGETCGLPVCRVNQAAVLIGTPACDQCFSSSCCHELNACYASRACKLMLECIATQCRDALSPIPPIGGPETCPDGGAAGAASKATCVNDCLCLFKDNDQGLRPADVMEPFALAKSVIECSGRADCGPSCVVPVDAGAD